MELDGLGVVPIRHGSCSSRQTIAGSLGLWDTSSTGTPRPAILDHRSVGKIFLPLFTPRSGGVGRDCDESAVESQILHSRNTSNLRVGCGPGPRVQWVADYLQLASSVFVWGSEQTHKGIPRS